MIRLLAFFFGCHHKVYSWPRKQGNETVVVCLQCGARIPYQIGKGKCSRWQSLTVACFLLLLVGCARPKETIKTTPPTVPAPWWVTQNWPTPKPARIEETITFSNAFGAGYSGKVIHFCDRSGQHAYKGKFMLNCWSEKEDRFVRLTLLEQ